MRDAFQTVAVLRSALSTRRDLLLEMLALRHQLAVLGRSDRRFRSFKKLSLDALHLVEGGFLEAPERGKTPAYRRCRLPVNVSAVEFRAKGFFGHVRAVLEETRLEPGYLELELTESVTDGGCRVHNRHALCSEKHGRAAGSG